MIPEEDDYWLIRAVIDMLGPQKGWVLDVQNSESCTSVKTYATLCFLLKQKAEI